MTTTRIALLLAGSALAGALSGFAWMIPNGLMAMALAVSLSLGTIFLVRNGRKSGSRPAWPTILATALLSGLAGGGLALLLQTWFPYYPRGGELEFGPPPLPGWIILTGSAAHGLVLQSAWFGAVGRRFPRAFALLWGVLGCSAVRFVLGLSSIPDQTLLPFITLFGAVPFAVLWIVATSLAIPKSIVTPVQPGKA
jgi:hypothetical protein